MSVIAVTLSPSENFNFSFKEVITITKIEPEDDVKYISDVDFITDDELYRGEALPGSLLTDAAWRIRHIIISADGDVKTRFAGGTTDFTNKWSDRLGLTYS